MPFGVFISHSNKDIAAADTVRARIETEKVRCWDASRDIPFGANWDQSVIAGLKSCRVLVLIFSSNANQSPQVLDEVKLAYETGLTIMPFRIEDETPGKEIQPWVSSAQWLDALTPPMERHLEKIALQVKACIDAMNEKGIVTPVPRSPIPAVTAVEPQPSTTSPDEEEEKSAGKKGRAGLMITLVLLLIAAAGAGWWFGTKNGAAVPFTSCRASDLQPARGHYASFRHPDPASRLSPHTTHA